ncbi:MAG: hypothetical protein OER88_00885 [Planctomycetota bacterium]|nr:hypothetical protein [Planctomycetota bacterium]
MRQAFLILLLAACAANTGPPRQQAFDPVVGKVDEGADLIGTMPPPLAVHWLDGEPDDAGKVRLVRWWTDACPLCSNSSGAIRAMQQKHGNRLSVRAIHHDKKRGRVLADDDIRRLAATAGYTSGLARDDEWKALRAWWLDAAERQFTSVTFLLGKKGRIRLIHTGGEFHAREHTGKCLFDPEQCAAEYAAIDAAVAQLVAE